VTEDIGENKVLLVKVILLEIWKPQIEFKIKLKKEKWFPLVLGILLRSRFGNSVQSFYCKKICGNFPSLLWKIACLFLYLELVQLKKVDSGISVLQNRKFQLEVSFISYSCIFSHHPGVFVFVNLSAKSIGINV